VSIVEICRICRTALANSFEHVPPRRAANDEPLRVYGIMDWLAREEGGLRGGRIEQRGAGGFTLCERCNNNTGSWYGRELVVAAAAGVRILQKASLEELDERLDPTYAYARFRQQPRVGPHPLRFIKQVVSMLLAVSPLEFSIANQALGDFVLEREQTGLPDKYQFYLALFAGPNARTVGGAVRFDLGRSRTDFIVEVAYPPFAYALTIDAEPEAIDTANITPFVDVGYRQMADIELDMLVGFGHTPLPVDYRTKAMIERDRRANEAA
jgi:hypothetical protein